MPTYFEFVVSLKDIKPRIWRRFQIDATATFADLHDAIQAGFGWDNSHLWDFRTPGRRGRVLAGVPIDEVLGFDWEERPDARSVRLDEYFTEDPASATCQYVYDFGDNWVHNVRLRQRVSTAERFHRRLLAGKRACPQEDSGGVWGYYRNAEFVDTGSASGGGDDEDLAEWVGDWKPDEFDLATAKVTFDA